MSIQEYQPNKSKWDELEEIKVKGELSGEKRMFPESLSPMQLSESHAFGAKKKILVISSNGGGGHKTAAEALERALGKDCEITIDYSLDKINGSETFNKLMKKGNFNAIKLLNQLQPLAEHFIVPSKIKPVLAKKIQELRPDLIISVAPVANYAFWELAKAATIPMLVLTTDIYSKHFFNNLDHPGDQFKIGLPFDNPGIKSELLNKFDENNFLTSGFPLRPEFGLKTEELKSEMASIRKKLGIQDGDKIILVMMGAQGGNSVAEISKRIAESPEKYQQDIHVVALCSTNDKLREETENAWQSPKNPNVIVHALGKKDGLTVAALMRMADVMVSKPGGATVNEAIASSLFTLYDGTGNEALPWEKGNFEFAAANGYGEELDSENFISQLSDALKREKPRFLSQIPGCEFDQRIKSIVHEITARESRMTSNDWGKYEALVAQSSKWANAANGVVRFFRGAQEKLSAVHHEVNSKKTSNRSFPKITYFPFEINNKAIFLSKKISYLSDVGENEKENLQIGFINGAFSNFKKANQKLAYISKLAHGYKVHGVINQSRGFFGDMVDYIFSQKYIASEPVRQLHKVWDNFFNNAASDAKFLQICHSMGATHVRNALLGYPKNLRKRIEVLTIAHASHIYPKTSGHVKQYRTEDANRDFIPRIADLLKQGKENVIGLPSQTKKGLDHDFLSPTYKEALSENINAYLENGSL